MSGPATSGLSRALRDLLQGFSSLHLWPMLGWQEVRMRYRRSVLGPFWLTLSIAVLLGAMGPLYGRLLNQDLSAYYPHLAVSFIEIGRASCRERV